MTPEQEAQIRPMSTLAKDYGHDPEWSVSYPVADTYYVACRRCGGEAMLEADGAITDAIRNTPEILAASCAETVR